MRHEYLTIDVFTDRPFGGSRLTLFPDGETVPSGLMQRLAAEIGCGETAFVLPARDPGSAGRLRIFTPTVELPFAGHSVLGATFALDHLGRLACGAAPDVCEWELENGRYRVLLERSRDGVVYSLQQDAPIFLGPYYHRDKVARALGLRQEDLAITGLPCEVVSTGLPIHVVPIGSLAAMARARLRQGEADGIARDLGFGDLYLFTCETVDPEAQAHCRMFAPHFGIPEDPASGSAAGALAAYLVKHRLVRREPRVRIVCEQGLEMGRPSRLIAEVEIVGGRPVAVRVGGRCVLVGEGRIDLEEGAG